MGTDPPSWPKHCACGLSWTADAWNGLTLYGQWHVDPYHLEMRHCTCGSTITMPLRLLVT